MRLSDLQNKKIVSIASGRNIGSIVDVTITKEGKIESLIIESSKGLFNINKELDSKIDWEEIEKIGEDVILIRKE